MVGKICSFDTFTPVDRDETKRFNAEDGCIEDLTNHVCIGYHDKVCADGQGYLAKDAPALIEFLDLSNGG